MKFDKDYFLKIVRKHSYFCESVSWRDFQKKLDATQIVDVHSVNELLKEIDKHSFAEFNLLKSDANNVSSREVPEISVKEIDNTIGVLELSGFYTMDKSLYPKHYQKIVFALDKLAGKNKILLDLSQNSGGNMYPWFAALAPLFDTKKVGYFAYAYKKEKDAWHIEADGMYCGDVKWFNEINKTKVSFKKIAVIISSKTFSSGEALAMSFLGQKNAKFFGEKTGGFTTGNEEYKIGDINIWLSTCMMEDRNQKACPDGITPNEITDKPIEKALKWLLID